MRVIVTDSDEIKTLAMVRALGRKGADVCVGGHRRWDQSFYSKYCRERLIYPNPQKAPDAFARFLLEFVRNNRYDVLLPTSDYTTITVSRHQAEFEAHVKTVTPDYETLSVVRDKPRLLEIARSVGIGTPETYCPSTLDEVADISRHISYPCVVKYKRGTGAVGMRYAGSPKELLAHYQGKEHVRDVVFDDVFPMIQEYIPGGIHDVCVLFNRGEPRAALTQKRVKMWPATGGRGVVDETTWEPELKDQAVRLLKAVKWHGPAQVEFKMDPRDRVPKLMEVNCRFWGGIGISIAAGMDFPWLACRMATEGDIESRWDYRIGLVYRWVFPRELESVLQGDDTLEGLFDYLRFKRGTRYDLSPGDPVPHVVKAGLAVYRPLRRLVRGAIGR